MANPADRLGEIEDANSLCRGFDRWRNELETATPRGTGERGMTRTT
jgi:hypothetical protein